MGRPQGTKNKRELSGYEGLIEGIYILTISDYKKALRDLMRYRENSNAQTMKHECERALLADKFNTNFNGEMIIESCKCAVGYKEEE